MLTVGALVDLNEVLVSNICVVFLGKFDVVIG